MEWIPLIVGCTSAVLILVIGIAYEMGKEAGRNEKEAP